MEIRKIGTAMLLYGPSMNENANKLFILCWTPPPKSSNSPAGGVTGIFSGGGEGGVIFPDFFSVILAFFPVEISILVDPEKVSAVPKKVKSK